MNQSLYDIINQQPDTFINEVLKCDDVEKLQNKLKHTNNKDRKAIIEARIQNLTYLAI